MEWQGGHYCARVKYCWDDLRHKSVGGQQGVGHLCARVKYCWGDIGRSSVSGRPRTGFICMVGVLDRAGEVIGGGAGGDQGRGRTLRRSF